MIHIFYHVSDINDYYHRFTKTLGRIINAGLMEKAEGMTVSLNGNPSLCSRFEVHPKIKVVNLSPDSRVHIGESKTINYLLEFCRMAPPATNVLYLHSKGVTKPDSASVNEWVDYMEHFSIERFEDCLEHLKTKNTVGTEMIDVPGFGLHYSGNIWWANSDYVKTLPPCADDYYAAEQWLLRPRMTDSYMNWFSCGHGLYEEGIKPSEYLKP